MSAIVSAIKTLINVAMNETMIIYNTTENRKRKKNSICLILKVKWIRVCI